MATLPRASKFNSRSSPASSKFLSASPHSLPQRPQSDFDAGLNSSMAWTEHLEQGSLSDEEGADPDAEEIHGRLARALFDFEGKAEFQELTLSAGDEIEVVKEELADGWSLVKNTLGEVGLLPRSYYTFTSNFARAPDLNISPRPSRFKERSPSAGSATPRGGSPQGMIQALPIIPQTTGEWLRFPSFRRSLLGGKSLNRFSNFVTSGAEEWVLKGTPDAPADTIPPPQVHEREVTEALPEGEQTTHRVGEADHHFVDVGPTWKAKVPPFRVLVHSPSKRTSALSGAYTVYSVTSLFQPPSIPEDGEAGENQGEAVRITVHRRFSHFVVLHTALTRRLPGIALPPLPEKQYAGRFSEAFVEARRGDLERYLGRLVRHPVARYAEVVTFFLGCESDTEWKRQLPYHLSLPPAGPSFYAHVFHPAFNVDAEEAAEAVERFDVHTRAVGKGVQGLRNIFGRVRDARVEMSKAERLLSYSLLSLITSKPLASAPMTGISEQDEETTPHTKGHMNSDGAWCWRENCEDCLQLSKAMQKTSEALQSIADIYDDHARRTQLATHEALKNVAHPSSLYQPVVDTHRSTLNRYNDSTQAGRTDEDIAARCETVLNTTMAEMETYHTQKIEDFRTLTMEHLDGEIALYKQILHRLYNARAAFGTPSSPSPRQPSIYERELENPRLGAAPLPQPCPHIFDSAPMRPVSAAIQGGVGMLLGPAGRGSVFGKFW